MQRIGRTALIAPLFAAIAVGALAAPAAATTGYEGIHRQNGAKCWFSDIEVNAPEVYAFDATTGVDHQDVWWTSELWRLDEATGAWVLDTVFGRWDLLQVSDGTDATTVIVIGGQDFTINVPGTYKTATRIYWAPTESAPAGYAYEWTGPQYQTAIAGIFGTEAVGLESCTF